jgi:hypothetical protein
VAFEAIVMILEIFSPKIGKQLAILNHNAVMLLHMYVQIAEKYHIIGLKENRQIFAKIGKNCQNLAKIGKNWQKLAKIAKNSDYNIDPSSDGAFCQHGVVVVDPEGGGGGRVWVAGLEFVL